MGVSSSSVLATTDEAATDVKGLVLASLVPHAGLDRHVRQHTLVIIVAGRLHRQHACHQRVGCSRILTYLCSLLSRHFEVLSEEGVLLELLLQCQLLKQLSSSTSWANAHGNLLNGVVDVILI